MRVITHEHRWTAVDKQDPLPRDVIEAVTSSRMTPKARLSPLLKADVLTRLTQRGWAGEVEIDSTSEISITSIKKKTGLCFQTGNMARMYADLLKLQTVFSKKTIDRGVFLVPTKACATILGSNIVNFERLRRELSIFEPVITMPLLVIGFE